MRLPVDPRRMLSVQVRAANFFGAPLRGAISYEPEALMDKARKLVNLTDFGGDEFQEPFRVLARATGRGVDLHLAGRVLAHRELLRCLVNRLKITEYCRRNPGTDNLPLPDPVVIVGLPRTGTTFLHRLLAQDPGTRTLRAFELLSPVPPGWGDKETPDLRLANLRRISQVRRQLLLSPHGRIVARSVHHWEADAPEECWPLLHNSFCSVIFAMHGVGEEYAQWLLEHDITAAYRYYRLQLQILTAGQSVSRLVVKHPGHLGHLDELLRVFPNARIVWPHRNPVDVVPSTCGLGMVMLSTRTAAIVPSRYGPEALKGLVHSASKGIDARRRHRPEQFLDVDYRELAAHPIATARRVHEFLGWQTGPEWQAALDDYLARDRVSRQGRRYKYTPEDFGLTADRIRTEFQSYTDRFPWVPRN